MFILSTSIDTIKPHVTISHNECEIKWEPTEGTATLYKSEVPHEGFEMVAEINLEDGLYIDGKEESTKDFIYYKINDFFVEFGEYPMARAKEIRRRDRWYLQNKRFGGGTEAYLWIRKTSGDFCPDCWDEVSELRTISNCNTCNGTGFIMPFYTPLKIYVAMDSTTTMQLPKQESISNREYRQSMWTTNFPLISQNDVIDFNGIRYKVAGPKRLTRMGFYITKQSLTVEGVEQHSPEMKLSKNNFIDINEVW